MIDPNLIDVRLRTAARISRQHELRRNVCAMSETPISLLERLRRQPDPQSWQRLVALYTPWMQHWLRQHSLQPQDTDDLIQEVMHVLVTELPKFEHNQQQGAFRRWLRTILVHRLRRFWQARQSHPATPQDSDALQMVEQLEDPTSDLSRHFDREHDRFVAERLLEQIKPDFQSKTWDAFQRTVLEGRNADEVADELGLSVNAVLIAKSRVLKRLRQEGEGLID